MRLDPVSGSRQPARSWSCARAVIERAGDDRRGTNLPRATDTLHEPCASRSLARASASRCNCSKLTERPLRLSRSVPGWALRYRGHAIGALSPGLGGHRR
jgi:hypothetical protein